MAARAAGGDKLRHPSQPHSAGLSVAGGRYAVRTSPCLKVRIIYRKLLGWRCVAPFQLLACKARYTGGSTAQSLLQRIFFALTAIKWLPADVSGVK